MKEESKVDLDLTNLPLEDLIDSPKHNKQLGTLKAWRTTGFAKKGKKKKGKKSIKKKTLVDLKLDNEDPFTDPQKEKLEQDDQLIIEFVAELKKEM